MAFDDQENEEDTFRLNIPDDARTSQKGSSFGMPTISYQARITGSEAGSLKMQKKQRVTKAMRGQSKEKGARTEFKYDEIDINETDRSMRNDKMMP